jgi:hypothetical protein
MAVLKIRPKVIMIVAKTPLKILISTVSALVVLLIKVVILILVTPLSRKGVAVRLAVRVVMLEAQVVRIPVVAAVVILGVPVALVLGVGGQEQVAADRVVAHLAILLILVISVAVVSVGGVVLELLLLNLICPALRAELL